MSTYLASYPSNVLDRCAISRCTSPGPFYLQNAFCMIISMCLIVAAYLQLSYQHESSKQIHPGLRNSDILTAETSLKSLRLRNLLSLLLFACLGMYSWSLPVLTGPYWSFTKTISLMCHRYMQLLQHSIHPSNEPLGGVVTGSLNLNFGSGCHIF